MLWLQFLSSVTLVVIISSITIVGAEVANISSNDDCILMGTQQDSSSCEKAVNYVYIYQEEIFHHRKELERCDPGGLDGMTIDFKHSFGDVLLNRLSGSKELILTENPDAADWFYVPFNVDRSQGKHVMQCGQNHLKRLAITINALENSPYYQRYKGADHVWYLGGWELTTAGIGKLPYFPFHRHVLHNMAIIRYADQRIHIPNTQIHTDKVFEHDEFQVLADVRALRTWWLQGQDHRCTINCPYRSQPAIEKYHKMIAEQQQTLKDWETARPYKFHFVGAGDDYPYHKGQGESVHALINIWYQIVPTLPKDKLFHSTSRIKPEKFALSLSKSQFCIMIRGDDPTRSRFYDALSAGCIPIIISDGFFTYGLGYSRMIHNFDTFTISIPESNWLVHGPSSLMFAVSMPRNELRLMHQSLMNIRPKLLLHINDDQPSQAAEYIFQALNERCKLSKNELQEYSQQKEEEGRQDQQLSQQEKIINMEHNFERMRKNNPATLGTYQSFQTVAMIGMWHYNNYKHDTNQSLDKAVMYMELALQLYQLNRFHTSNVSPELKSMISEIRMKYNEIATADSNGIDWTDPIFLHVIDPLLGWENDPIVVESHKVVFFPISKVACTQFKMLFRRIIGRDDYQDQNTDLVHDPKRNGLTYLGQYSRDKQREIMISSVWTRAIFVRDPIQRLLSAYSDVVLRQGGKRIQEVCCGINSSNPNGKQGLDHCEKLKPSNNNNSPIDETILPFKDLVNNFIAICNDVHWRPQVTRMMAASWKTINFVGRFENLKEDTHKLLEMIGAYDEYGSQGWGPTNGAIFESNLMKHATSGSDGNRSFYKHDDKETMEAILNIYRDDYEHTIINLTKPE